MNTQASELFGNAKWIQGDSICEAPLFRKSFSAGRAAKAAIRICGLGFFELYLNGQRVSNDLLVPGWSNYEERAGRVLLYPVSGSFHNRIYYLEYDLTPYLSEGINCLAVRLGNGWYNNYAYAVEGDMSYGFPKLCYKLELDCGDGRSGTVVSDETTLFHESEILVNNIHTGEVHDLRRRDDAWNTLRFDDSKWVPASAAQAPNAEFCLQDFPPDRVIRAIHPSLIWEEAGRRVYDCGENITGYPLFDLPACPGEETIIRYSETYAAEGGKLDFSSTGGQEHKQEDRFIGGLRPFICHPRFTWHGFRYFEVIGNTPVKLKKVAVVHADIPVISSFESSDSTLNWIFQAYLRSQLGNLHCGVPSDCPHRERLGYTGDGQVTCRAAMFCLDMRQTYVKWMRDIVDSQDQETGHVQHTAPFYGGGGGPGGWGGAIFILPWQFYLHYGDSSLLDEYFLPILRWLDYMENHTEGGLVTHEEEGGWCLGDWCAPETTIPEPFVNTYYYILGMETAVKAGQILGKGFDKALLEKRIRASRSAMLHTYFDAASGSFCSGVNGADAFAVDLGLGDSRTLDNLVSRYTVSQMLDTGIFGTDLVIDVLFRNGFGDLAYTLLTSHSSVSFHHMQQAGATTLWESWDGSASLNHPMFGGVLRSFFTHILGIQQKEGSSGYRDIVIRPADIRALDWVRGSVRLGDTMVKISICRDGNGEQLVESDIRR